MGNEEVGWISKPKPGEAGPSYCNSGGP